MKLPIPQQTLDECIDEFDVWVKPFISTIQNTEKFQSALENVASTLEIFAAATNNFSSGENLNADRISHDFSTRIKSSIAATETIDSAIDILSSLAITLYLVTGKSNNNVKCQFPIFLRNDLEVDQIPAVRIAKSGKISVGRKSIPRVFGADELVKLVSQLEYRAVAEELEKFESWAEDPDNLLSAFIQFVLSDENSVLQLWSIGQSFHSLQSKGREHQLALLTPLIIFQVRGSVSASGGHEPEDILRDRMNEWGMLKGTDYNNVDVIYANDTVTQTDEVYKDVVEKTRAYDFILPYKTPDWNSRIFIQCQFYAGDSGSVSHKNVDQTKTSRSTIEAVKDDAIFVEYADGAGYCSSLNGDLKRILSMENTKSFFQVNTSQIRLRRELQNIGFATPLDLEHAVLTTDGTVNAVTRELISWGFQDQEVQRAISIAEANSILKVESNSIAISNDRIDLARRYFILDMVALYGKILERHQSGGYLLIPGYGPYFGMKIDALFETIKGTVVEDRLYWSEIDTAMRDIVWLCDNDMAKMK